MLKSHYLFQKILLTLLVLVSANWSCHNSQNKKQPVNPVLSVFHAGSLSVPMKNLAAAFKRENPEVTIQLEASGSLSCVRKITELNQICDVLALADFNLIDDLVIPVYADWNILFAANELCLVYQKASHKSDLINTQNWFEILLDPDVRYGRSDPDADPCGYRTVLVMMLADRYYPQGVKWQKLMEKDTRFIRGKETDLNALLESRTIDYMFNYRSVAVQHGFNYLKLPDSINLGNPGLNSWYSTAEIDVRGSSPDSKLRQRGASILYGLTIPLNAPNLALAEKFVRFITDPEKGRIIIEESGQAAIEPLYSTKTIRSKTYIPLR